MDKTYLKGREWTRYLYDNDIINKTKEELYQCTYRDIEIYKIGKYYFYTDNTKGYLSLKGCKNNIYYLK